MSFSVYAGKHMVSAFVELRDSGSKKWILSILSYRGLKGLGEGACIGTKYLITQGENLEEFFLSFTSDKEKKNTLCILLHLDVQPCEKSM